MVTKRIPLRRTYHPSITPEMIAIWNALREIVRADDHLYWEADGGRRDEFFTLNSKLNNELLGRAPHECPVIRMAMYGRPPELGDDAGWARWGITQAWQRKS